MEIIQEQVHVLPSGHLNAENAAKYLGKSTKTLATWRVVGLGPVWRKFGNSIRYPLDGLETWVAEQELCQSTAQADLAKRLVADINQKGSSL